MMIIDTVKTDREWLVVVPEIIQIENLRNDIKKHGYEHLYRGKIRDVVCYASFKNYEGEKLNIWFNEAHRLTKLKEDVAKTIDYDRIIADSATIPSDVRLRLERLGDFAEYTFSMQEAVEMGLLPAPRINIVRTNLDSKTKRVRFAPEDKEKKKALLLTDVEYSKRLDDQIKYWQARSQEEGYPVWISNKIKQLGSQRKKFLAESKTELAKKVVQHLKEKRLLCYAGSIEQCNILGNAVHSRKTKKQNLEMFNSFNSYETSMICMNKMGREGLNLEGIEAMLIVQLSSGKDEGLEIVQRFGRALRADSPEIYVLVCNNTIDEAYLERAMMKVERNKIKYINDEQF
jgi:hypothetical protein